MMNGLKLQIPYNQFSPHDEEVLSRLCGNINGDMCEIGCWLGHSTYILASRCKETGSKLYVIDSFKGNEGTPLDEFARDNDVKNMFIENMNEAGLIDSIVLYPMDSSDAYSLIPNVDLLFIDAGHTYSQVAVDIAHYKNKAKFICGHDYESETYDESHINEDYVNGKHHGVIKAVNEAFGKVKHEGRMWWVEN